MKTKTLYENEASATARAFRLPEKEFKGPFTIATENVELIHECFPKYFLVGTARMK